MTGVLLVVGTVALMALFVAASLWYFRRIGEGRADPVINPSWTTMMRPTLPPPPLTPPPAVVDEYDTDPDDGPSERA